MRSWGHQVARTDARRISGAAPLADWGAVA